MTVIDIKENEDGSALVTFELEHDEIRPLMSFAIREILIRACKENEHDDAGNIRG